MHAMSAKYHQFECGDHGVQWWLAVYGGWRLWYLHGVDAYSAVLDITKAVTCKDEVLRGKMVYSTMFKGT